MKLKSVTIILGSVLILLASYLITSYTQPKSDFDSNQPSIEESRTSSDQNSQAQLISNMTDNWQEYSNDKYGYTIKFPQDWHQHQTYPDPSINTHIVFSSVAEDRRDDQPYAIFGISMELAKDRNLKGYKFIGDHVMDGYEKSTLEISNTQAAMLITSDDNKDLGHIVILRDGYFYRLTWNATTRVTRAEFEEIFKQIIATFKFTHRPKTDNQQWI
ncbi:PsbP-related protein [Patescibacteria group bacterium]